MATSAFVPGAGENADEGRETGPVQALAQAREEAATLREVLGAIAEALSAAAARLDALEAQVSTDAGEDGCPPAERTMFLPPPMAPSHASPRTGGWKAPGWSPAPGSASAGGQGDAVSGETLRLRREALGISQAAVAHAAHCSRGLVAEVERGKRRSAQTLAHLAKVLDRLEQQARRN